MYIYKRETWETLTPHAEGWQESGEFSNEWVKERTILGFKFKEVYHREVNPHETRKTKKIGF